MLERIRDRVRSLRLMLSNYVTLDVLRHNARRLWRARTPQESEDRPEAAERFLATISTGEFTKTWLDAHLKVWNKVLAEFRSFHAQPDVLEIGSWEGRSTIFFLTFFPEGRVTAIDTWAGGDEHQKYADLSVVERRFDANVAMFRERVTKMRGASAECLSRLVSLGPARFDLVFVDGSHYADDVMVDAVLAWALLRRGGILIFDDYLWMYSRYDTKKNPCRAINLFLRLMRGEYQILHAGYQLMIRKTATGRHGTD